MRETTFIQRNQERWKHLEDVLEGAQQRDPTDLADAYVQLSDDLAFARSQFPRSAVASYLNQMTSRMHETLMRTRRERLSRFKRFWAYDVPMAMYGMRTSILVIGALFILTVGIGFFAGLQSLELVRAIIGDRYVDMTLFNIKSGDPMAVYKQDAWEMFLRIGFNNVVVMLRGISFGLIPIVGPAYMTVMHGVMIGSFHGMFAQYGELSQSLLTVYVHGALELSLLVISSAAGLAISLGFLRPGTYTRRESFKRAVRNAGYVGAGSIPFIIVAAALESFVTRLTDMPVVLNVAIILCTLGGIWWYALVLPRSIYKRYSHAGSNSTVDS